MLTHNITSANRIVHPPHPAVSVMLIPVGPVHLLTPLVEELRVFTEDSLGHGGIKIIHAPPSYERLRQ
jgi:hypothetical protein